MPTFRSKLLGILQGSLLSAVSTIVTLELAAFALSKAGLLHINEPPPLYKDDPSFVPTSKWRTEHSDWGAWHLANSSTEHARSCFYAVYTTNEIGARDSNRFEVEKHTKRRYILLGDSFAEGYGVNIQSTAQSILEQISGAEVLNFGSAGDLGPVQYWILYEQLARAYKHDGVIIFFLPDNDFSDNDYDHWVGTGLTFKADGTERWRPYYRATKDDREFEAFIPPNASKGRPHSSWLSTFVRQNLWMKNLIFTAKNVVAQHSVTQSRVPGYSGYFDAKISQQQAVIFFIKQIINGSLGKDVYLVAIPRIRDLDELRRGRDQKVTYWYREFVRLSNNSDQKFRFIDLAEHVPDTYDDLFLECDGHWSARGNQWAAEVLFRELQSPRN